MRINNETKIGTPEDMAGASIYPASRAGAPLPNPLEAFSQLWFN